MNNSFTREQIKSNLAEYYRIAYSAYEQLAQIAKDLAQEGDKKGFKIIDSRAKFRAQYFHGIMMAAEALGISEEEFMEAVNQDRAALTKNSGKGDSKC